MIKFIIKSYSFRKISLVSLIFLTFIFIASKLFDIYWQTKASFPITNLNDVYRPPSSYDNITRINLKILERNYLAIESNKKFRIYNKDKNYDYYDTILISYPENSFDTTNKIYLNFEDDQKTDSLYLVVSKSEDPKIFYKQIFYSTVKIEKLNQFSDNTDKFRIKYYELEDSSTLTNNDSLIKLTISRFNEKKDTLTLTDCGSTCNLFKIIADSTGLPCRIITLQGGDQIETGYHNALGYPLHVICEIYSSRLKKWYVIDPTYGLKFRLSGQDIYLNAVEINNHFTFNMDHYLGQDSVLFTKRTTLGRDYFKFYENIYFTRNKQTFLIDRFLKLFYNSFDYHVYHYSNYYPPLRNGLYYFLIKSFMYFIIIILYINLVIIIITKRLFQVKKPRNAVK